MTTRVGEETQSIAYLLPEARDSVGNRPPDMAYLRDGRCFLYHSHTYIHTSYSPPHHHITTHHLLALAPLRQLHRRLRLSKVGLHNTSPSPTVQTGLQPADLHNPNTPSGISPHSLPSHAVVQSPRPVILRGHHSNQARRSLLYPPTCDLQHNPSRSFASPYARPRT